MYKSVLGSINKLHKKGSKIDTPNTQIHDRSLPWFGTGSSIKSGWVKLVLRTQTFLWIFPAPKDFWILSFPNFEHYFRNESCVLN